MKLFPLIILLLTSASLGNFRFIHETDPHVNLDKSHLPVDTACWKEMHSLTPQPAFMVDTGDNADHGLQAEYKLYLNGMKEDLRLPYHVAPGNHDVRWNPLGKEGFTLGMHQPLWQSWNYQGIHFVLLDSTVLLEHWGHFDQAELDWLKNDLSKISKQMPVIIGFHHWIGRNPVMDDNAQALLDVVKPYNVRLWLQGHGHQNLQWNIDGTPAIMEQGLYQGAYMVIDVDTKNQVMHLTRRHLGKAKQGVRPILWTPIMTISLKKVPQPDWSALAEVNGDQMQIQIHQGNLPPDTKFSYCIDQGKFQPIESKAENPATSAAIADLCAGHHTVTVEAMLADGRVYQDPVPVLLDRAGMPKPAWQTPLGSAVQSHLVRNGNSLYVTTMGGDLCCLDPGTGKIKWKFHTDGAVFSTPAISDGIVYFGSADHGVYAIEASNGEEKWHYRTGAAVFGGPAVAQGVVAIVSTDKNVYGLDAATGSVKWTSRVDGLYQSNAATDGSRFYIAGWDNHIRCLDANTGKQIWIDTVGRNPEGQIQFPYSPAVASPTVEDGKLFIVSDDGVLHAINSADGKMIWEVNEHNLGYSSPLWHAGVVYAAISDHGNVLAVDGNTGKRIWTNTLGSDIYDSSFTFSKGKVFIAAVDGTFSCLDAGSGKIVWQYVLGPGHVLCSPAADASNTYISSMSGVVTALPIGAR